ncbi:MAG: hypothetical protein JW829_00820, partial [Pirellulales bacterium]|nr:hypothetical protein [Pirellulales bacterium]
MLSTESELKNGTYASRPRMTGNDQKKNSSTKEAKEVRLFEKAGLLLFKKAGLLLAAVFCWCMPVAADAAHLLGVSMIWN